VLAKLCCQFIADRPAIERGTQSDLALTSNPPGQMLAAIDFDLEDRLRQSASLSQFAAFPSWFVVFVKKIPQLSAPFAPGPSHGLKSCAWSGLQAALQAHERVA